MAAPPSARPSAPARAPLRALVLCPGRGSYGRSDLGSVGDIVSPTLDAIDAWRARQGRPTVRELDGAERYQSRLHVAGEHASILTAGVSLADLDQLDPNRVRVAAVCGNSMGWYTALGYAGALGIEDCARLIDTMGAYQAPEALGIIGGQIVYSLVDDDWHPVAERVEAVERAVAEIPDLHWSIRLGGQAVLGGTDAALAAFTERVQALGSARPDEVRRLPLHSAFHTRLMAPTAERARRELLDLGWRPPRLPLVDGTGRVWRPRHADPRALAAYTLGDQVVTPFDFSTMVRTALLDYGPDVVVLPGPGSNLGGAIGQVMVSMGWRGIRSKADFVERQRTDPVLISMRWADQRGRVVSK